MTRGQNTNDVRYKDPVDSMVVEDAKERVRAAVTELNNAVNAAMAVRVGTVLTAEEVKWKQKASTYHIKAQFLKQEVFW